MNFPTYLDKNVNGIIRIGHYYEEFKDDPKYLFELYALQHFTNFDLEFKKPHYNIDDISQWLTYIEQRALSTPNLVLRSRYNDILWTYRRDAKKVLSKGNVKDKCETAISDYIHLSSSNILNRENDDNLGPKLRNYLLRAWDLTQQIKSKQQPILVDLMIEVESTIEDDESIGLWGFSYKKLIQDTSVTLTPQQEQKIIDTIIRRIKNLDTKSYRALEYGINKLLEYYKDNREKQLKYFDLLNKNAHIKSERPFENQERFRRLVNLCHKYQLTERKEKAIINYQHYGEEARKYMRTFEKSIEITPEIKQTLLKDCYHENPAIHFLNIADYFIYRKDKVRELVQHNKEEFIFGDIFPPVIINQDGVSVKAIKKDTEDELFLVNHVNWQVFYPCFAITIQDFQKKHVNKLKEFLYHKFLYEKQEKTLQAAIQAYFDKDYFAMCYISIPLIENGLRNLLFLCDRSIYEENKHDGFENITLTRVLNTLNDYLTDDVIFHLKFVLNEKAGLNLRNRLTHGLMSDLEFNEITALTLLHTLMVLRYLVGFKS